MRRFKEIANTIKAGEFCVVRLSHSAAFLGGLQSQYTTFEIVRAEKVNIAGKVFQARTQTGSPLKTWDYLYSIGEWQAEADRLFGNGETIYDDLKSTKEAFITTREQLTSAAIHEEEARSERALGVR